MQLFKKIFPEWIKPYGLLAIAALIAMNTLTYYGSRILASSAHHYDLTTALDRMIPFIPEAIVIYALVAYAQWGIGYYFSACEDKRTVIFIIGAEIIAKIPSMIIFLFIPTTMIRADVTGTDIFSWFVNMVYSMDTPDNLFPSFHVLESYLLLRTLPLLKKAPDWYKKVTPFISPIVIFSILFVKQHLIVDIIGGIAVCEFGLLSMKIIFKLWDAKFKNASLKKKKAKNASVIYQSIPCDPE